MKNLITLLFLFNIAFAQCPPGTGSLNVTINIRWLVQLIAIIGSMVTAGFTLQSDIKELKINYEAIDKIL